MPKRLREERADPHAYLGGDFVLDDGDNDGRPRTKRERNETRKQQNRLWKLSGRMVGSGVDPNPRHSLYYKAQLPVELGNDAADWMTFQSSFCTPLPVTLRFGGHCPSLIAAALARRLLSDEFRRGRYVEVHGQVVTNQHLVHAISWCEAYQVAADSASLAKEDGLAPLSNVLLREVALGHVVRQELASMIPVLLLGVHHTHTVLDVCAAPGSKTEQILAAMERTCSGSGGGGVFSGMVVANDADPKRIQTLRQRYARSGRANLLVHCSRAEDLCRAVVKQRGDGGGGKFDRIVADVPCSGDGTFRKFPHLWRLFRPRISLDLHLIQLQIAKAAALMLKDGGRLVYSTCSINPLEDEAVVAALVTSFGGRLRLVDVVATGLWPAGLKARPGVLTWQCDEDIFTVGEPDDAARKASKARLPTLVPSMHPPSQEAAAAMHLDRCMRILPHDNDTGGFFVAVLEKVPKSKSSSAASSSAASAAVPKVSAMDAIKTLQSLGYNPKLQKKKGRASKDGASNGDGDASAATGIDSFEELGPTDPVFRSVVDGLGLQTSLITGDEAPCRLVLACAHQASSDVPATVKAVHVVSASVLRSLKSWATAANVFDAGVAVCHVEVEDNGSVTQLALDPDGARALLPLVQPGRVVGLSAADFLALTMPRPLKPLELLLTTLSSEGQLRLIEEAERRLERKEHCHLLVQLLAAPGSGDGPGDGGKRRLSKSERKKLKAGHQQNTDSSLSSNVAAGDRCQSGHKPDGMVLALRFTRRRGTLTLHVLTAEDMCASYKDALASIVKK